jgi:hypothetical protein
MNETKKKRPEEATRDRAILIGRLSTVGGAAGALGLTWLFSNLSAAYFSGKPPVPAVTPPPAIPVAAAPVQKPPTVIQTVVHHPYSGGTGTVRAPSATAPRPPAQGPAPAPPPPAPVCHSTPSKPC